MAALEKLRTDYAAFPYLITELSLDFDLGTDVTTVISALRVQPANQSCQSGLPLVLDGCPELQLGSLFIDGCPLPESEFELTANTLTITRPPDRPFVLGCTVCIKPQDNTKLEGLYRTSGNFCSHCEAEGFRNITFFPDRSRCFISYTLL